MAADDSLIRFKRVVAAALLELENRREEVNDLNVFPVADGDTGDNMALTMRAVVEELAKLDDSVLESAGRDEIVSAVARAALLGARGNSGVILSQVVRGAAEELASRPGALVDPVLVSAAFARAADAAYASVRDPAEGTMLTAVRAMASRVAHDLAHMDTQRLGPEATAEEQDELLAEVLENALEAGKEAVERGPEQLAVLREAGVVDAGAYGLTVIVAGCLAALRGEDAPQLEQGGRNDPLEANQAVVGRHVDLSTPTGESGGLRDLAGLEAARADVLAPGSAPDVDADLLEVRVEAAPRRNHGMAAAVPERRALSARIADLCHGRSG